MRIFKNVLTVTLASALVLLAFPTAALALNTSWSAPVDVSVPAPDVRDAQVTVDSTGLAIAIWSRSVGNNYNSIIESSTRPSGGNWSVPVEVTDPLVNTWRYAYNPQITVDSSGLVTAIWKSYDEDDTYSLIQSSTLSRGGTWSPVVNVFPAQVGEYAYDPEVAVDSTGLVTAIWINDTGTQKVIDSSTSQSGGDWSEKVTLPVTGGDAYDARLAVDSTGLATAIWRLMNSFSSLQSSTSQSGGEWSLPINLSVGEDFYDPQVTTDLNGFAIAIWEQRNVNNNGVITVRTSQSGGAWSEAVNLSDPGLHAIHPQVVIDSSGVATAIWKADDEVEYVIQTSTYTPLGTWSTPVAVSGIQEFVYKPRVTVDSTGSLTAIWTVLDQSESGIVYTSSRPRGGLWSTPLPLSAAGMNCGDPKVAADSPGLVTAIWLCNNGNIARVQSSSLNNPISPTSLAKTGADAEWLALVALIAVSAGASFFALARRKRTARTLQES